MTTLQPRLVRADTLDLQSHDAPSAKDHTRSPTFSPYTHGTAGSHHKEALRNAEESAYHDRKSSPRMSSEENGHNAAAHVNQYDSTDEDGDDEHQDGPSGTIQHDGDYDDGHDENDEDLEDDLLDKISSSPSIEDGKYSFPFWPPRVDSIGHGAYPASSSMPTRGTSPPILEAPLLAPIPKIELRTHDTGHHLSDSLVENDREIYERRHSPEHHRDSRQPLPILRTEGPTIAPLTVSSDSLNSGGINHLLFPADDPLLCDFLDYGTGEEEDIRSWIDEEEPWFQDDSSSDDDLKDFKFSEDPRFIDSGWGGECLRETEDIDFEFVYALHTFVATVEGQANATKGDTMVLLDDSNSYWWLVRVVKDGSIGYLPAEHIETPTERLARLNKHRNIDLSASMLGDNPEKSKNPLKKAMRRRNAKTVAFTAPTYYEPSEYDYDSEDDEDEDGVEGISESEGQTIQDHEADEAQDEHRSADLQDSIIIVNGIKQAPTNDPILIESPTSPTKAEVLESTPTQLQPEENISRSRNGTVRNTDSFFKDDTMETKKISLTPRLLQTNVDSATNSEQDLRSKASSETFDKMLGADDKSKDKDKEKKKEKKGMLSGFFKRKDKSAKNAKSDTEEEKADDSSRAPQTKESLESISGPQSPDKKPGKLQKHPTPTGLAIRTSPTEPRQQPQQFQHQHQHQQQPQYQVTTGRSPTHSPNNSVKLSTPADTSDLRQEASKTVNTGLQPEQANNRLPAQTEKRNVFAPITNVLKSTPSSSEGQEHTVKPVFSKRAKERFAIDGSDSEDDQTPTMSHMPQERRDISPIRTSQISTTRPDSAMEVSPVEASDDEFDEHVMQPRALATHPTREQYTSAHIIHDTPQSDTASTSKPSPSLATHTPSTSRSTPTWSDASLRSYMESDQDIRDLLIIVHDKSNVTPVGPDHPLMGGLFTTERTRLAEMQTQLDSMLTTWISKKTPGLLAR